MVSPASRMSSAISLGVLARDAPSTSAIMRSMKVLPDAAVMRTSRLSETTCVPPVTAERSPPASRITGADSPVMALSLMEAIPRTISPSSGIRSPVSTSTMSPTRNSVEDTVPNNAGSSGLGTRLARVSLRARRRLSARARPRPSAIASAKVANSTVSHSQAAIASANAGCAPGRNSSRTPNTVVSRATTSVTKMTGLRASLRGSSLVTESRAARAAMRRSNSEKAVVPSPGAGTVADIV